MAKDKVSLYLIRLFNEKENFYKIGITVHRYSRFYQIMKFGYKCEIIYQLFGNNYSIFLDMESFLHCHFSHKSYDPIVRFGGHRECYIDINCSDYIQILRELYPVNANVVKNLNISWR